MYVCQGQYLGHRLGDRVVCIECRLGAARDSCVWVTQRLTGRSEFGKEPTGCVYGRHRVGTREYCVFGAQTS